MTDDAANATRVAIVDDHILVSEMLALSVSKETDLALAGTAGNTVDAIRLVKRESPDVVLLNYRLPYGDCVETIKEILLESPTTRVILLSTGADADLLSRARAAGCVGFLDKEASIAAVLAAIRAAARGEIVNEPTTRSTSITPK